MLKAGKRSVALLAGAAILCGLVHVVFYSRTWFEGIACLFCGAVTTVWGISVLKRITDRRLRNLIFAIDLCLMAYLLMEYINYCFAQELPVLRRYAWYGYYPCMMAAAMLLYECSASILRSVRPEPRYERLPLLIAGTLLSAGVMTNDLHQLAFRFEGEAGLPSGPCRYGPVFYLFMTCFVLLLLIAFGIVMRKHRVILRWINYFAPVPLVLLGAFLMLNLFGRAPKLGGIKLWQMGDAFCFGMMTFLEICIATHLIPANTAYGRLFALSGQPAVILETGGEVKYASAGCRYPFPENEDTMIMRHPIAGGSVEWAVDVSVLNALNRDLTETTQRIEARNAYLSQEARIKKEKAEAASRNRIYDEITRIVRPQLMQIGGLLEEPGRTFDQQLPAIAVRCAYIKRRSNMELLAENGKLPFGELSLAVSESLVYVRALGVRTASTAPGAGTYPADMVIAAYARVESVLEQSLDGATDLMVSMRAEPGAISVRMMLRSETVTLPFREETVTGTGFAESVSVTKEGQDMILAFLFREGGGAL